MWEWERLGAFGVKISNIQIDYLLNIAGTGRDLILPLTTNYNVVLDNYIRSHTSHICRAWCLCWRTGTARSSSWCSRATSLSSLSGSSPSTTSSQPWTKHVSTDHILYSCRGIYFSGTYISSYCFMSAINMATPNYSVCACTVIGNRYILWSYFSPQLGILSIWNNFPTDISPFINDPMKVEEVFALFPISPQNQKLLESWESWVQIPWPG